VINKPLKGVFPSFFADLRPRCNTIALAMHVLIKTAPRLRQDCAVATADATEQHRIDAPSKRRQAT
jgi:hypothetical protein